MRIDRLLLAAAVAIWIPACSAGSSRAGAGNDDGSTGSDGGGESDGPTDEIVRTHHPTYTAVWDEILAPTCALQYCHGGTDDFLPMTTKEITYSATVNVTTRGPKCGPSGLKIVAPGNPDGSLLYQKVTAPTCGDKMPAEYEPYLDSSETAQIRQWIVLGAPND